MPPQVPQAALPSPQELNPAQRRENRPVANPSGDVFMRAGRGPCPLADSPLRFTLQSVSFSGVTAASPKELSRAYAGLIGKDLPVSAICDIRDHAADILFSKGVLVRVEIPEQTVSGGAVKLEVIEARVVSVTLHGDAGPAQAQVSAYLEKLRGMRPFNLRKAQRYLLLASDVPGVRVQAALAPSSEGRGAVNLEVTVSRDAVDVLVSTQNLGSQAIGRWGVLGRVDLNGYTPFGERTSLVAYGTPDSDEQRIVQITEEARIGASGLMARGSFSYALTKPGGDLKPLALTSDSYVGSAALVYPLIRTRRETVSLIGGIDVVNQKTDLPGSTLVDDKLRVLTLRGQGEWRSSLFRHAVDGAFGLEVRRGLDFAGASKVGEVTLSRTGGDPEAWVARIDGRARTDLPFGASLKGVFFAQYADSPLLTYEQISIGDLTIGRGYDPASVSGDSGAALSVELMSPVLRVNRWAQVSAYAFSDAAYVHTLGIGGGDRSVHSAGVGFRSRLFDRVNLDVAYAHPFDKPVQTALEPPKPRVLVTLTAQLF